MPEKKEKRKITVDMSTGKCSSCGGKTDPLRGCENLWCPSKIKNKKLL